MISIKNDAARDRLLSAIDEMLQNARTEGYLEGLRGRIATLEKAVGKPAGATDGAAEDGVARVDGAALADSIKRAVEQRRGAKPASPAPKQRRRRATRVPQAILSVLGNAGHRGMRVVEMGRALRARDGEAAPTNAGIHLAAYRMVAEGTLARYGKAFRLPSGTQAMPQPIVNGA